MRTYFRLLTSTMLVGGFALGAMAPAFAASDKPIGEITVTAQKRKQNLKDVPLAVSVIDSSVLENANITNMQDITTLAPSLNLTSNSSGQASSFNIRGIGSQAFSDTVEPSVAVVLDGVVLAKTTQAFKELFDVDRVEVLRGPQGTLFGKNSSAGVVSVVTKDPTQDFEGYADFRPTTSGGDQSYKGHFVVNGGITDTIAGRLGAYATTTDSFIENNFANGPDYGGGDSYGARGKLLWEVNPQFNLKLGADISYVDSDCCQFVDRTQNSSGSRQAIISALASVPVGALPVGTLMPTGIENDRSLTNSAAKRKNTEFGTSLEGNLNVFGDHTLTSITAYRGGREQASNSVIDADGLPVLDANVGYAANQIRTSSAINLQTQLQGPGEIFVTNQGSRGSQTDQFSQELRLASPSGGFKEYTVGLFAFHARNDNGGINRTIYTTARNTAGSRSALLKIDQTGRPTQILNTNAAIFGQLDIHPFTPKFTFTIGGRGIYELLEVHSNGADTNTTCTSTPAGLTYAFSDTPATPILANSCSQALFLAASGFRAGAVKEAHIQDTNFTDKVAAKYDFFDNVSGYISYSRGYKGPAADNSGNEVDPETANSYEIGLKNEFFKKKLILNIAAFKTRFKDFQAQAYDVNTASFRLLNAGNVVSRGLEVDTIARPWAGMVANIGGNYVDSYFDDFKGAPCYDGQSAGQGCVGGVQNRSGADTPNSPNWRLTASARQYLPIGETMQAYVGGAYRWQSKTESYCLDGNPGCSQGAYGIFDLNTGVTLFDGDAEVELFVKNVFDKFYASTILDTPTSFATTGGTSGMSQIVSGDASRTVGANLTVRF